jgi:hypothetical protein
MEDSPRPPSRFTLVLGAVLVFGGGLAIFLWLTSTFDAPWGTAISAASTLALVFVTLEYANFTRTMAIYLRPGPAQTLAARKATTEQAMHDMEDLLIRAQNEFQWDTLDKWRDDDQERFQLGFAAPFEARVALIHDPSAREAASHLSYVFRSTGSSRHRADEIAPAEWLRTCRNEGEAWLAACIRGETPPAMTRVEQQYTWEANRR